MRIEASIQICGKSTKNSYGGDTRLAMREALSIVVDTGTTPFDELTPAQITTVLLHVEDQLSKIGKEITGDLDILYDQAVKRTPAQDDEKIAQEENDDEIAGIE